MIVQLCTSAVIKRPSVSRAGWGTALHGGRSRLDCRWRHCEYSL